ncbi:MAG: hypothetical protein MR270_00835 [Erysipelotrichaceae bacterium]|nr:hypothetical protein [Erysipelotrichaceae bacterium]
MKKKIAMISILLLPLVSCATNDNVISFEEYVQIVTNASCEQKNIFVFESSSCPHCKKIKPLINEYMKSNEDVNIYMLSVDYKYSISMNYVYDDKTMGYLSGDSSNDCIKRLDNRIAKYVSETKIIPSTEDIIFDGSVYSNYYIYTFTPLILWYEGNIEVKIANNVEKMLEQNDDGKIIYSSFESFMAFPNEKPSWNQPFDLTSYK